MTGTANKPLPGDVAPGAVITGGSSGIGRAVSGRLLEAGWRVVSISLDHDADGLRPTAFGGRLTNLNIDVRDRGGLEVARSRLEGSGYQPRLLVANAGINVRKPFLEVADESVRAVLDTNLYGAIVTLQTLAPMVLARRGGRIILTSSVSAIHGTCSRAVYSATKAALSGLARSLAIEWADAGATVNAVGPGIVDTPLVERYMEEHPAKVSAALQNIPAGRLGEPSEVADLVFFLASDAAAYINGQTLMIDGGLTAGSNWW